MSKLAVTVKTEIDDIGLAETTQKFRIAITSVSKLEDAKYPGYVTLSITY